MFDEAVLREISLSDGSSKLIFKHVYIYIFLYIFLVSSDTISHPSSRAYNIFRTNFKFSRGDYQNSIIKILSLIHRYYFKKGSLCKSYVQIIALRTWVWIICRTFLPNASKIPIIRKKKERRRKKEKKKRHVGCDHLCRLFIRREEDPFDHRPIDRA